MQLKGSVGKKGMNHGNDVEMVQIALNRAIRSPLRLLSVDKLAGRKTVGAIEAFQKHVLKFSQPDGLIEAGGKTWAALAKYLVEAPKARIITHAVFPEFMVYKNKPEDNKEPFSVVARQHQLNIAWGARVSPAFKRKVILISTELQVNKPSYKDN
jgi:hypothetical protein